MKAQPRSLFGIILISAAVVSAGCSRPEGERESENIGGTTSTNAPPVVVKVPSTASASSQPSAAAVEPRGEELSGDWQVIATFLSQSCGIRRGALYCWGGNDELSNRPEARTENLRPKRIGDAADWQVVTVGAGHACGLREHTLYCWGSNFEGRLGQGNDASTLRLSALPLQVGTATDWSQVATGYSSTCGVRSGELYCWGHNGGNVLGIEKVKEYLSPTRVDNGNAWSQVALHTDHGCGIQKGLLYCWGSNEDGRIGLGVNEHVVFRSPTPKPVVGRVKDWSKISAGEFFNCGLSNGELYCWGANNGGQQGVGDSIIRWEPIRVGDAKDWSDVATGAEHVCAIRSGMLYCWGRDWDGQLGIGKSIQPETCMLREWRYCNRPERVGSATDWTSVATGGAHTCAIRSGNLYCWGNNNRGQLGLGDKQKRDTPVEVR